MKKIVEFNWPEDKDEYQIYDKATDFYLALTDFAEYLRTQNKYIEPKKQDKIDKVREKFYEILNERGVEI